MDPGIFIPYTNMVAEAAGQSRPSELPAPSEPMLSSIGVLDRYIQPSYGKVAVRDFWVGVETVMPQLVCHLWTWQGRMRFCASYNETFYVESFVQDFLRRVMDIVKMELGV